MFKICVQVSRGLVCCLAALPRDRRGTNKICLRGRAGVWRTSGRLRRADASAAGLLWRWATMLQWVLYDAGILLEAIECELDCQQSRMTHLLLFLFSSHPASQSFIPPSFISSHFKFKMYLLSLPFPSPMTHLLLFSFHPSLNFYRQPRSSPKTFDCFSPFFPLSLLFMFLFSFNLTFYVTFLFFSYPVITLHAFLLLQFSSP